MILIDYKDRRPIYEQIVEKFQRMILRGILPCEEPMPSVRNLAMELSLNPNTIQRAYQELERTGYIYTVKGKGSFVSDTGDIVRLQQEAFREDMKNLLQKAFNAGISEKQINDMLQEEIQVLRKEAQDDYSNSFV